MTDKIKEAEAFTKLMQVAKDGSLTLYTYENDYHKGGRNRIVGWQNGLLYSHFRTQYDRQCRLNETLERLVEVNFPNSVEQMNKERGLARLVLDAGANPNFYSHSYKSTIFDQFLSKRKSHIALEIAKTDGFLGPENTEQAFDVLAGTLGYYMQWKKPMPGDTEEESAVIAQNCADRRELVYRLFQIGLYPRDEKVFQSLVPVILERDPAFFENKKKQVASQLLRAKTPLQIYSALKGQEKERT